jgi:hypothetical protein
MKLRSLAIGLLGLFFITFTALAEKQQAVSRSAAADRKAKADAQATPQPGPAAKPATRPASAPIYAGQAKDEWESYQAMHAYILDRFVRSEGFGMERMPRVHDAPRYKRLYADGVRYVIGHVELISLNDGKEPFIYWSGFDDAMKNALKGDHLHVSLVEGEADALAQLKEGKEVVLTGADGKRELVGAVRATADCTKCHNVKEGTLLGAFRYPLLREPLPWAPGQAVQRAR